MNHSNMEKLKFLWFTDTHLNRVSPIKKLLFIKHIIKENPQGIFLTGDISCGAFLYYDLYLLATFIKCPIYFVLGNHDYWYSNFKSIEKDVTKLCKKFKNLIWLSKSDPILLNKDVAIIGDEGWYDGYNGNNQLLKFTFDQYLIKDFQSLSFDERLVSWRNLAKESNIRLEEKLQKAIDLNCKTIYLLTHCPPWKEATRDEGTILEKFWLPYNTNIQLGIMIEKIMKKKLTFKTIILCGHIHQDVTIHVSSNIECKVNTNKFFGWFRNEEIIYI